MSADEEELTVTAATREDMPVILEMIHELAAFEGVPEGPQLSVSDLVRDGFESSPAWFSGLVARRGGAVAGHALFCRAYSSWGRRALYLEDLYVRPWARRRGVGAALVRAICQEGVRCGACRLDWHVLADNAGALAFYRRLGAQDLRVSEGRLALRLHAPDIAAAAASDQLDTINR